MGGAGSASGSDFCPNLARLAFPLTPLECAVPQNALITLLERAVPKTKDLKSFRMRRSEKSGGNEGKLLTRNPRGTANPGCALLPVKGKVRTHTYSRSALLSLKGEA